MKERKIYRIIINSILISAIFCIVLYLLIEQYQENQIKNKETTPYDIQTLSAQESEESQEQMENTLDSQESLKQYPKEEIIQEYKGYDVAGKLKIPKIELETYILQNYSEAALDISVTKFWGANANQIGNFCVAGHNFKNKNMFRRLKELEVGDKLEISDNTTGRIEYEIYDIYQVEPEDISCLSQETNQKREVTLITCTNDSKKRIIVKAREVEMTD